MVEAGDQAVSIGIQAVELPAEGMGPPKGRSIQGDEGVGRLPLGQESSPPFPAHTADTHRGIFEARIHQHHPTGLGLADLLHDLVIGLACPYQDQQLSPTGGPQMVAESADALSQLRSIAAGQGSGTGIGEEEPERRAVGLQLAGKPQHHRQQPQPLEAHFHGPAAAGLAGQG